MSRIKDGRKSEERKIRIARILDRRTPRRFARFEDGTNSVRFWSAPVLWRFCSETPALLRMPLRPHVRPFLRDEDALPKKNSQKFTGIFSLVSECPPCQLKPKEKNYDKTNSRWNWFCHNFFPLVL